MQITSENSKMDISCIYVNYRSTHFLEQSLESLFQFERDTFYEVIVVNNDHNEQQEIENLQSKFNIRVIPSLHNPGFGTSANIGAREAKGEVLFFVNPDTKWKESIFRKVLKKIDDEKKLGALGLQLVSLEGKKEEKKRKSPFSFPLAFSYSGKELTWVSGGALFIPKEKFRIVGGFDERFFMYFEDMDLCVRLQELGFQVFSEENYELIHYGGKSHVSKKSQKKLYDRSLYQYTKKHWSFAQYYFFRVAHPFYRFLFPYGRR